VTDAFDKAVRGALVALAHRDVQHQFGMAFDCDENVAITEVRIVRGANALLFFPDEAPKLIRLYVAHFDVANFFRHDAFAFLADLDQQLQDRGVMHLRGAFDARHGVSFEQETDNHLRLLHGQVHTIKWLVLRREEGLGALLALKALVTLAVFTVLLTFGPAIVAGNCDSP
jgi:hypothetical protein